MIELKKCSKCGRELPLSEFHKNKNTIDGYAYNCKDCFKEYRNNPMNRAKNLIANYRNIDRKKLRGVGDLTPEWIIENIFSKPCAHCGIEGWQIIGCNRIDDSKPHTMDNVEPCCKNCNNALAYKSKGKRYVSQFKKRKRKHS